MMKSYVVSKFKVAVYEIDFNVLIYNAKIKVNFALILFENNDYYKINLRLQAH